METSAEEGDPIGKVGAGAAGGTRGAQAVDGTKKEDLAVVGDPPA